MNGFERSMDRGLKGADFYRLRCDSCGDFTAALAAGQSLPTKCFWCERNPMYIIHRTIRALTRMQLPEWSRPQKTNDIEAARATFNQQVSSARRQRPPLQP